MQENTGPSINLPTNTEEARVIANLLIEKGAEWGISALTALIILVIGLFVAGWIKGAVRRALTRANRIDSLLISFLSSFARYVVLAVVIITVLSTFGVQTTSLAALLGAAGIALGLALQGTLGHVASGIMLLAFRPFKIGDYVGAGGEEGTVKDITIFMTEMATVDNKKIIIPNGMIWAGTITNYSANPTRRLDMVFGISYDDDIGMARDVLAGLIDADTRVHKDPAPVIEVNELNEFSVDFTARLWLAGTDYFAVKWELNRKVKEAFDKQGISIPFPTATHIQKQA